MAAFTGYAQPGPGMENGMAYGTQPPMANVYPGEPQGPGPMPYGPFTAPEPVTPRWYFRGEAVWLSRNNPNDRNLTSYNNSSNASDRLNNRFILDTDDLGFGLTPGMRLTLGHYLTDRTAIEGQFYGTNNWDERTGTRAFPSAAGPVLFLRIGGAAEGRLIRAFPTPISNSLRINRVSTVPN